MSAMAEELAGIVQDDKPSSDEDFDDNEIEEETSETEEEVEEKQIDTSSNNLKDLDNEIILPPPKIEQIEIVKPEIVVPKPQQPVEVKNKLQQMLNEQIKKEPVQNVEQKKVVVKKTLPPTNKVAVVPKTVQKKVRFDDKVDVIPVNKNLNVFQMLFTAHDVLSKMTNKVHLPIYTLYFTLFIIALGIMYYVYEQRQ